MRKVLLLCALVASAALTVRAEESTGPWACPDGLAGDTCGTCTSDAACVALTQNSTAWCYTNFTYTPETVQKNYACSTEGTPLQDSVTNVWAQCYTDIEKCDVHFALSGHPLTCSSLECTFGDSAVSCGYTKCSCDSSCPSINGVSLGYLLDKLEASTAIDCDDFTGVCNIEIKGLSTTSGGFQAFCQAGECRTQA